MLDINMEFRKGILFVRLSGELTKNTVNQLNEEVTKRIEKSGINNVVFNIEELNVIDIKGIHALFYNYEVCHKGHGKTLLCGLNNTLVKHRIEHSRLLKYMLEASDELSAFTMIDL